MKFSIGSRVRVRRLNQTGKVIEISRARYRVQLDSLRLLCREDELEPAPEPRACGRGKPFSFVPDPTGARPSKRALEKLDLHGMRVEEALRSVEQAINAAILARLSSIEIVHGIGTGKLRDALHRYLGSTSAVSNFRYDPLNPGITTIYL